LFYIPIATKYIKYKIVKVIKRVIFWPTNSKFDSAIKYFNKFVIITRLAEEGTQNGMKIEILKTNEV